MDLNDLIKGFFEPHVPEIREYIVNEIINDIIDVVIFCIIKDVESGKLRLEGVLDKDKIYKECLKHIHYKEEA